MSDVRRLSVIAVALLVVLRIAIGWQLLYEGLWKIDTLSSPKPWTAAGYLKNAQGPFRDTFRNMAGDPDELDWLNYDVVAKRWDNWAAGFTSHYGLDGKQKGRLDRLLNGRKEFRVALAELPEGVDLADAGGFTKKVISYDDTKKQLVVTNYRLQNSEKEKLLKLVADKEGDTVTAYKAAIEKAYKDAKALGYKEKLAAAVRGNPDVVGNKKQQYVGDLAQYKSMLAEYNDDVKVADQAFEWDHAQYTWKEVQAKRSSLVGPIKAMEKEFQDKATNDILSIDQLKKGAAPQEWTSLRISNLLTIAGLTILGVLLIVGLFTRFAAIMAAIMLFSFYLVWPPFPGVPAAPGPEHSLIVNKNLIEVFALIAIAATSSGVWFGLDAVLWKRKRLKKAVKATS